MEECSVNLQSALKAQRTLVLRHTTITELRHRVI